MKRRRSGSSSSSKSPSLQHFNLMRHIKNYVCRRRRMTEQIKQTSAACLIIAQFIGPNTRKSATSILPASPPSSLTASRCRPASILSWRCSNASIFLIKRLQYFYVYGTFTLGHFYAAFPLPGRITHSSRSVCPRAFTNSITKGCRKLKIDVVFLCRA